MNDATATAATEEMQRLLLGGQTLQEYQATALLVSVLSIAIVIIFFVVLYLNRNGIMRWLRGLGEK